jgi:hypothetical protein
MAHKSIIPAAGKLLKKRVGINLEPSSMELGGSEAHRAAKRCSVAETLADEFGEKFATALALLKDDILSVNARYDTSGGKL